MPQLALAGLESAAAMRAIRLRDRDRLAVGCRSGRVVLGVSRWADGSPGRGPLRDGEGAAARQSASRQQDHAGRVGRRPIRAAATVGIRKHLTIREIRAGQHESSGLSTLREAVRAASVQLVTVRQTGVSPASRPDEDAFCAHRVARRRRDDRPLADEQLATRASACRTSSSQTKSTGASRRPRSLDDVGALAVGRRRSAGAGPIALEMRETCRSVGRESLGGDASLSRRPGAFRQARAARPGRAVSPATSAWRCSPSCGRSAARISYASRLMFSRCCGEMLSDVMLPPHPPHPSVIAGSSPVVSPIDPCVVGVLTHDPERRLLEAELAG